MLHPGTPALVLAPMEGVTDAPMRAFQGELGGFSYGVSEFIRISSQLLPDNVYLRHVPELATGGNTPSGLPVQVQLLGGDPERLAESAAQACRLGAKGIDLNFGCPAQTVNRHDGGATLLKYPERLEAIVRAVREAVPRELPVSAKLRLGWEDPAAIDHNAERAERGGASWITIHGRTKVQGYGPPADWKAIARVRRSRSIPVIANGDIWSRDDFERCREMTGCEHFMIGRGALADPSLVATLAGKALGTNDAWDAWFRRFLHWCDFYGETKPGYAVRRIKQWLNIARKIRAVPAFDRVKVCDSMDAVFAALAG